MLVYNLRICQNVCNFIDRDLIKHITYISSDAVYKDSSKPINENSLVEPDSLHGLMHMTREKILKSTYGNKLCILRPTLIYGKNDPHNGYGPNSFIRLAKKNKDIKIFGKGEERRDHIHVEDVIKVIFNLIKKNKIGVFNICSGKIISFNELAKKIIHSLGSKSKIIYLKRSGPPHHLGLRRFNIYKIKKNIQKIKIMNIKQNLNKNFFDTY